MLLVKCPFFGHCKREGVACENCANNENAKPDHFKPIQPFPTSPFNPIVPKIRRPQGWKRDHLRCYSEIARAISE